MTQSDLDRHLQSVRRDGFTSWRRAFTAHTPGGAGRPSWTATASIERVPWTSCRAPGAGAAYVPIPTLLDLLEGLMGPFVGLAGSGALVEPSCAEDRARRERVWHRDMWPLPGWTDDYLPPDGVNVLTYLQGGEAAGPLRVLPGSHRGRRGIPDDAVQQPHPDELAVRRRAGTIRGRALLPADRRGREFQAGRRYLWCSPFLRSVAAPGRRSHDNAEIGAWARRCAEANDRRVVRLFARIVPS